MCMIARDNERTIRAALESIRPWVGELIVVDTGSTDRTPQICAELGARVYRHQWPDSFAAARNLSLQYARGEWVFWMDTDDTMPPDCGQRFSRLVLGPHDDNVLGYVMQVHCPGAGPDGQHDVTVVDHLKLFRNRPDLRFEFRIHEQVIPSIRRAGGLVQRTDIYVVHSGADHTPAGRRKKLDRDLRLLRLDLAERPDHPFVLFNLGMTHADAGEHGQAVEYLLRAIEVAQPDESQVRKAYALLVASYSQLERHDDAWRTCLGGLELFPRDPELLFRAGMLHHHFGRLAEAEQAYLAAQANNDDEHFSSLDRGIVGFKASQNLAAVYVDQGALDKAEAQWRQIVQEVPTYRDGWRGLGEHLLRQKRHGELDSLVAQMRDQPRLGSTAAVLAADLAEARGDLAAARRALEAARGDEPEDLAPLRRLCQHLFFHATTEEAEQALVQLAGRDPQDAAALHNLGTVRYRLGRHAEAGEALRASLRLRPDSLATQSLLDSIARQMQP
jgi:tetratricopeptide (TPR) repeat protein